MAKKKILIVDAEPGSARLLEVSLRQAGYSVASAFDGAAALETLAAQSPDLVVCDTTLPTLDGYGFVRRMQDHPEHASIPVVLLTSARSVEDKIRALELGVEDCLTKPVFLKELLARVDVLLARRAHDELARARGGALGPLTGSIHDTTVVDLLQAFESSRRSGVVRFESGARRATVWLANGKVVDAELGPLRGEEAVYRLLVWREAEFAIELAQVDREDVVELGTPALLVEGMRRADEWGRLLEQLPPLDARLAIDAARLRERLEQIPGGLEELLRLLDGERSLADVVDESPFDDLSTLSTLAKLYFEGLLVPPAPAPAPAPEPEPEPEPAPPAPAPEPEPAVAPEPPAPIAVEAPAPATPSPARPPTPAEEAWVNGAGASDPPPVIQRKSGPKVAAVLMAVTLTAGVLIVSARRAYRGDHDTYDGLAVVTVPTASAVPTPKSAPSSREAAPAAAEPPTNALPASAAPSSAPAPEPTAARAAPSASVRARRAAEASADAREVAASVTPVEEAPADGPSAVERETTRAAQLAFLATTQNPGDAEAWLALGAAYEAMGKKREALQAYRRCVQRAASHARVDECRRRAGLDP